jgi:hypothetical protein
VTERPRTQGLDDSERTDVADPGATPQPAEGGRDEVADLPGADTSRAADEPAREDDQDRP